MIMSAAPRIVVVKPALLGLLLIVSCCYSTVLAQSTNNNNMNTSTSNGDDLIWFNDVQLWNITNNTSAPVRAPFRRSPTRRRPVQKPRTNNVNTVSSTTSTTSSPTTMAPTTMAPSTPKPSTPKPSSAKPTTSTPTREPTPAPTTRAPTLAPTTNSPSVVPTVTPTTAAPTSQGTIPKLRMTLKYMPTSMDVFTEPTWENITSTFVMNYWQTNSGKHNLTVQGLHVTTLLVDQQLTPATRRRRQLQTQQENSIVYQQIVSYTQLESSSSTTNLDLATMQSLVATLPFETLTSRTQYVVQLQATGNSAFQNVFTVTPVSTTDPNTTTNFFQQNWMWIAIGAAAVAVLLFLIFLCYFWKCRKENHKHDLTNTKNRDDYFSGTNYYTNGGTASQSPHAAHHDDSTLNEPMPRLGMISSGCESLAGYGDQSVTTIDYDYTRAYGGGGGQSVVSSASATLGGWTNPGTMGGTTIAPRDDNPTIASDDASFAPPPVYTTTAPPPRTTMREELLDIICPPGKLGVVIDTPTEGPPQVHAIKDSSCVADKLRVGDKVVAVDQEDVRAMTAIKVSKMISRKSANPTRVLTILRVVDG